MIINKICLTCKKAIIDFSRTKTKKFCNRSCFGQHYKKTIGRKNSLKKWNSSEKAKKIKQKYNKSKKGKLAFKRARKKFWIKNKNNKAYLIKKALWDKNYRNSQHGKLKRKALNKKWYNHKGKFTQKIWRKKYYSTKLGKAKMNAKTNLRRAIKINATPKWVNKKEKEKIINLYKNCKKGYHIDHIIPLKNKYVCGLHTFNNLQILKAKDNIYKSNKFIPFQSMNFYTNKNYIKSF